MTIARALTDAFGRIRTGAEDVLAGLDEDALSWRPAPDANSVAWLVWHITRIQDQAVAALADRPQLWTADGWAARFAFPFDDASTGNGHTTEEVAMVRAPSELLSAYLGATTDATLAFVAAVDDAGYGREIEDRNGTTTLATRLVRLAGNDFQHLGQAAYVKGMLPTPVR